jgi:hypothetical protein
MNSSRYLCNCLGRAGNRRNREETTRLKPLVTALSSTISLIWVQVLRGHVTVNGEPLSASDGAPISEEESLFVSSKDNSAVVLFDLA